MTTAIAPSTDAVVGSIRSKLVEQGALHSIRAQLREHVYAALLNTVDKGSTARPSLAGTLTSVWRWHCSTTFATLTAF